MMLFKFFKDKWVFLLFQSLITMFFCLILNFFKANFSLQILIFITMITITITSITIEYLVKIKFYRGIFKQLNQIDKKRLISELIKPPNFMEGILLCDFVEEINRATNNEIVTYQNIQEEYKRYIETWIHEIKTPISAIEMICKNNLDKVQQSILKELKGIESYVDQALYYSKISTVEKDYIIRECDLNKIVKSAVKNNSTQLISIQCTPSFENLNQVVYTDTKWMEFILSQLIMNSIKYRKDLLKLSFSATEENNNIILSIEDNGIGIPRKDLDKIFEKGFTGENGRRCGKSTGIGLYICKSLCEKMNHKITVHSTQNIGTTVHILFPKNKLILFK